MPQRLPKWPSGLPAILQRLERLQVGLRPIDLSDLVITEEPRPMKRWERFPTERVEEMESENVR